MKTLASKHKFHNSYSVLLCWTTNFKTLIWLALFPRQNSLQSFRLHSWPRKFRAVIYFSLLIHKFQNNYLVDTLNPRSSVQLLIYTFDSQGQYYYLAYTLDPRSSRKIRIGVQFILLTKEVLVQLRLHCWPTKIITVVLFSSLTKKVQSRCLIYTLLSRMFSSRVQFTLMTYEVHHRYLFYIIDPESWELVCTFALLSQEVLWSI